MVQITELEEYYPYRVELAMLQEHAGDIISHIPTGSVLVELGCGSASKTAVLQRALLARFALSHQSLRMGWSLRHSWSTYFSYRPCGRQVVKEQGRGMWRRSCRVITRPVSSIPSQLVDGELA